MLLVLPEPLLGFANVHCFNVLPVFCKCNVCVQVSCLCDESGSLDGRSGATFTIKPVVCCVALRSRVVNDTTGASVRAERIVKRL